LTFFNILGDYSISHDKKGHVLQKEDVWYPYYKATHMRPVQI